MKQFSTKSDDLTERSRRNLLILETIRRSGPISKAEISRIAGVNVVTISNYIDGYLRNNLVRVKALDVSAGGRRPALLALNPQGGLSVGIGLNLLGMTGLVIDLNGQILARVDKNRPQINAKDVIDVIIAVISELFEKITAADKEKIEGIGIGIAGIIDHQNGTIRWPRKLEEGPCEYGSIDVPLADVVEKKFRYPCLLENDATSACRGEQWMTLDASINNVIYMFSGVGCGFILNGEVFRGTTGGAGEISLGGIPDSRASGTFAKELEELKFFQPWTDDLGLVEEVSRAIKGQKITTGYLYEMLKGKLENITLRDVFLAAKSGDPLAVEKVKAAGRRLGIKTALLVNLLNPQVVIVGGGMEAGGSLIVESVKSAVLEFSFSEMANAVKIIPSRLGADAVAIGAASLIVRQVFSEG